MLRRWSWIGWIVPVVLAIIGWQGTGGVLIDLGGADDLPLVAGFHNRERNPEFTFRWSMHQAQLKFAAPQLPALVHVRGKVAHDGTQTMLRLDETSSIALPPVVQPAELRNFFLYWPGELTADGQLVIPISAQTPGQPLENRELGVLIDLVEVRSLDSGVGLPPLLLLLAFGSLALLIDLSLRLALVAPWLATLSGVTLSSGLVLAWQLRPLWVQPFLLLLAAALLAITAMIWWLRWIYRAIDLPAPGKLLLSLIAASGLIPLYSWQRYGFTELYLWLPLVAVGLGLIATFAPARYRRGLLVAVGIALVSYGLLAYLTIFEKDYADDFTALFRGPRAFLRGGELYDLAAIQANHLGNSYKYPPFFALIMAPLTGLAYSPAIQLWRAINLLCLLIAVICLWRGGGRPLRSWSTLGLALLLLTFQPLVDSARYGQVDHLILAGVAGAYLALRRQRWTWAGVCLALPIALKLYPAYLLGHALSLRRWRSVGAGVLGVVLLIGGSMLVLGWSIYAIYATQVLPISGGGTVWVENQTLNGWLNRLISPSIALTPDAAGGVAWLTVLGAIIMTIWTAQRAQSRELAAGFCLWIIAMLIVLPIGWIHYEVLLLIPFFHLFVRLEEAERGSTWRFHLAYALAWALLVYGNQWMFFNRIWYGPIWALVLSYKLYGMLLLWAGLAYDPLFAGAETPAATTAEYHHQPTSSSA